MSNLDELGVEIAESLVSVIEEYTDALISTDEDILRLIEDLTELVLNKYGTAQEDEEEDNDVDYYGDMDEFSGEEQ